MGEAVQDIDRSFLVEVASTAAAGLGNPVSPLLKIQRVAVLRRKGWSASARMICVSFWFPACPPATIASVVGPERAYVWNAGEFLGFPRILACGKVQWEDRAERVMPSLAAGIEGTAWHSISRRS
jgi:hypothetical protein